MSEVLTQPEAPIVMTTAIVLWKPAPSKGDVLPPEHRNVDAGHWWFHRYIGKLSGRRAIATALRDLLSGMVLDPLRTEQNLHLALDPDYASAGRASFSIYPHAVSTRVFFNDPEKNPVSDVVVVKGLREAAKGLIRSEADLVGKAKNSGVALRPFPLVVLPIDEPAPKRRVGFQLNQEYAEVM